jgi:DNA-binding transcriptional LysR family regulator
MNAETASLRGGMDLRHLRYFQAVAEELSFSGAARRLRIAQPALSRAVQELEEACGVRLLDRNRRVVKLTPAGAVMLREAGLLFERWEESLRRVQRTAAGEEGELRLGYIGPPTRGFLASVVKEYRRRWPRVTVVLEERTPERVAEMVARGRLSAGITRPVLAHSALRLPSLLLRAEPFCAVVPEGHEWCGRKTVGWKELAGVPLVLLARREGAGSHDAILAACREAGVTPRLLHTPSLMDTILRYVAAGEGVGVVPDSTLGSGSEGLELVPLTPRRTVPLVMVWHPEGDEPPVRAFRELMEEWLAAGRMAGALDEG